MARRSRLFSLSALTRSYQRSLKALVRAARPVRPRRVAASAPVPAVVLPVAPPRRPPPRPRASGGEWLAGIAPGPAGARRFHLYTPPGLQLAAGERLPLLVMLHGCGQTGRDLAASSRMNRLAVRERFLVLYPEQERAANPHGCWNWFERRSGRDEAEAATLLAAVDLVARRHPVDLDRVAVAGLSAGASMAALMAARYPQRLCAVVMHSGVAPGTADSSATALVAMHGRRSAHLPEQDLATPPYAGRPTPNAVPLPPLLILHGDADGVVSSRNAVDTAQLWAQALQARAGASRTVQRGRRHAMRVTEYRRGGRAVVVLREVVGLAHAWSGGAPGLAYSDPSGPDASALAWAFIVRQFKKKT